MAVTEVAKPFDGTPISNALEFRKRNRRATGDIVDAAYGSSALQVSVAGGGASINLANGRAIVQGALYELSGGPKNIAVTTPVSTRTDYAVLTYDDSHNPGVYARVLEGTALTQNDTGTWDFPLATWQKTAAGAITNLVDLRQFLGSVIVACTSTTRPTDPTVGMIAYETDTGRHIKWTGTAWLTIVEDTGEAVLALNGKDKAAWNDADPYNPLRYRRKDGVVSLRFSIQRVKTGLGLSDTDGSTAYVLPVGFKPPAGGSPVLGFGNHSRSALQIYIYDTGELRIYPLGEDMPIGRRVYGYATFPAG